MPTAFQVHTACVQALAFLEVMQSSEGHIRPDTVTYNTVLKACRNAGQLGQAMQASSPILKCHQTVYSIEHHIEFSFTKCSCLAKAAMRFAVAHRAHNQPATCMNCSCLAAKAPCPREHIATTACIPGIHLPMAAERSAVSHRCTAHKNLQFARSAAVLLASAGVQGHGAVWSGADHYHLWDPAHCGR